MSANTSSKKQTSKTLRDKQNAVLKANAKLNDQETKDLFEKFRQEADPTTGRMNKEQFLKYYQHTVGANDKNALLVDNVFAMYDTNHDGTIDFSEFVLAVASKNKASLDSTLELAFEMIDTSGDDHISFDELVNFINRTVTLVHGKQQASMINSKQVATDIFSLFGVDIERKLSKQQFIDGCKKNSALTDMFGKP